MIPFQKNQGAKIVIEKISLQPFSGKVSVTQSRRGRGFEVVRYNIFSIRKSLIPIFRKLEGLLSVLKTPEMKNRWL